LFIIAGKIEKKTMKSGTYKRFTPVDKNDGKMASTFRSAE
jgi:hypothetical protein